MKKSVRNSKRLSVLALATALALSGCASSQSSQGETSEEVIKIGATQIMDHPSLNMAREGFEERLTELGIKYEMDYQNAGGDLGNSQIITEKFIADKYQMIYAISTPSAQAAQNAAKASKTPVVFTAVTDAVSAGLVDENSKSEYITGVLDATSDENVKELLEVARSIKDDKKATSVIYNTGEANSIAQVEQIKKVASEIGLEVVEVGISALTDIDQAMEMVGSKADSLFLISDKLLASSMDMVAQKANAKGLVTVTPIASFVESGALISIGIDYKQLGMDAADMAKQILVDKVAVSDIPVSESLTLYTYINKATAEKLSVDIDKISTDTSKII